MQDAGLPSLECMAHTLQLAVHEGVLSQRSISDIIATGRRIVGHFKHSALAYSELQNVQPAYQKVCGYFLRLLKHLGLYLAILLYIE